MTQDLLTALLLAELAEFRDPQVGDHVLRVAEHTMAVARGLPGPAPDPGWLARLGPAAMLHDVGKVTIPAAILDKPGQLDDDEWGEMKQHAERGAALLRRLAARPGAPDHLALAAEIAAGHHERWDGEGYPQGVAGDAIPLAARLVAVCDVYDALTHDRPYQEAWTPERALALVQAEAGRQFDPAIVATFVAVVTREDATPLAVTPWEI